MGKSHTFIGSIWTVVVCYLLLAILFFRATPLQEATDEARHVGMTLFIKDNERLPNALKNDVSFARQEATQAPLYYVIGALLISGIDTSDAADFYVVRPESPVGRADLPGTRYMFKQIGERGPGKTALAICLLRAYSILLGALTLIFVWLTLERLGHGKKDVLLFAVASIAFNPMWLFISSSVNNDNLVVLLTTIFFWAYTVLHESTARWKKQSLLGIVAGAAILAKQSAIILVPAYFLVQYLFCRNWRNWWRQTWIFSVSTIAVSGWWFLRNLILYGELTATRTHINLAMNIRPAFDPFALIKEWHGFIKSFWGVFGAFNIIFSDWVYYVCYTITFSFCLALPWLFSKNHHKIDSPLWMALIVFIMNIAATAAWTSVLYGSQGRLLFPSLAALAILSIGILKGCVPRFRKLLMTVIAVFLFVISVYAAQHLIPNSYY